RRQMCHRRRIGVLAPRHDEEGLAAPTHPHLVLVARVLRLRFTAIGPMQGIADAARQVNVGRGDHGPAILLLDADDALERMLGLCPRRFVVHETHDLVAMRSKEFALERQVTGRVAVGDAPASRTNVLLSPFRPRLPMISAVLVYYRAGGTDRGLWRMI